MTLDEFFSEREESRRIFDTLRAEELERARGWGGGLAQLMKP